MGSCYFRVFHLGGFIPSTLTTNGTFQCFSTVLESTPTSTADVQSTCHLQLVLAGCDKPPIYLEFLKPCGDFPSSLSFHQASSKKQRGKARPQLAHHLPPFSLSSPTPFHPTATATADPRPRTRQLHTSFLSDIALPPPPPGGIKGGTKVEGALNFNTGLWDTWYWTGR